MSARVRSTAGASIVELLVLLAVLCAMVCAALPNLERVNHAQELGAAVSGVESTLHHAREVAIRSRTPVRVRFERGTGKCVVEQDVDHDERFGLRIAESNFGERVVLSSISFGGGEVIVFDEHGVPDRPGSIVLRTPEGSGREVLISAGSGNVSVLRVATLPDP